MADHNDNATMSMNTRSKTRAQAALSQKQIVTEPSSKPARDCLGCSHKQLLTLPGTLTASVHDFMAQSQTTTKPLAVSKNICLRTRQLLRLVYDKKANQIVRNKVREILESHDPGLFKTKQLACHDVPEARKNKTTAPQGSDNKEILALWNKEQDEEDFRAEGDRKWPQFFEKYAEGNHASKFIKRQLVPKMALFASPLATPTTAQVPGQPDQQEGEEEIQSLVQDALDDELSSASTRPTRQQGSVANVTGSNGEGNPTIAINQPKANLALPLTSDDGHLQPQNSAVVAGSKSTGREEPIRIAPNIAVTRSAIDAINSIKARGATELVPTGATAATSHSAPSPTPMATSRAATPASPAAPIDDQTPKIPAVTSVVQYEPQNATATAAPSSGLPVQPSLQDKGKGREQQPQLKLLPRPPLVARTWVRPTDLDPNTAERYKKQKQKEDIHQIGTSSSSSSKTKKTPKRRTFTEADDGSEEYRFAYIERLWTKRALALAKHSTHPSDHPTEEDVRVMMHGNEDLASEAYRYALWMRFKRHPNDENPVPGYVREEEQARAVRMGLPEPVYPKRLVKGAKWGEFLRVNVREEEEEDDIYGAN